MYRRITVTAAAALLLASLASAQVVITPGTPFFDDFEGNAPVVAGENCPGVAPVGLANGWTNASGDDNEWTPDLGGTPSIGTGPLFDQNPGNAAGIYLYTEASGTCASGEARLESPQFDISGLTSTQAAFDYWVHLDGAHSGSIHTDVVEQVNSGSDGSVAMASDVFNSVSAAFTANHVGTQVEISGSAMGNDGVYTVIAFIDVDNVQLDVALAATESGLSFTHTFTIVDALPPVSGDNGVAWMNTGEALLNSIRLNFGADGNEQLITVVIRGINGGGFQSDMAVDGFTFRGDAPAFDFSVSQVTAPSFPVPNACLALGASEIVTVELVNNFIPVAAGTMVPLSLDVNGGMQVVNETFMTPALNQGDTFLATFATPVDLSMPGTNTVTVSYTGTDAVPGNDVFNTSFDNPMALPQGLPFLENFDTFGAVLNQPIVPMDWINDPNDGTANWLFENDFPSSNNGPNADHTTGTAGVGWYAYIEDSVSTNSVINLLTPCIDLSGTSLPVADFWFNSNVPSNGAQFQNMFAVDLITSGGIVVDAIPQIGDTAGLWQNFSVGLSPFIGDVVRIQFRGRDDNGSTTNDYGLDDVQVRDLVGGPGQAPQAGLATLDYGNGLEMNGLGVPSLLPGPYFASVNVGGDETFRMGGEPNQAIILLGGSLSVNAVFFAGIGQLDIGPPLEVLGDGTSPGFLNSFFVLDAAGSRDLTFPVDTSLSGFITTLQAVMFNTTGSIISFSNAVEVTFL